VLHEEWREVLQAAVEASHHYVARIIEDLYDDRKTIEALLAANGRKFATINEPSPSPSCQ